MEWGPQVKDLLALWKETGTKPAALVRKPQLNESDRYFYVAFWELTPSRGSGEAFGPIPESEFFSYWLANGVVGIEERSRFRTLMRLLDNDFVSFTNKKRKEQMEKMQQKKPQGLRGSSG